MRSAKNKIKHIQKLAAFVFGLTLALSTLARPAQAQKASPTPVNACGDTLGHPGKQYMLTTDLDCSGTFATAINVTASNVVFHLAGHTLSSTDCDLTKDINGIFVSGNLTGVTIDGGTVSGFNDGIVLSSSKSHVTGMTVTKACLFGIALQGTDNQLDKNVVTLSGLDGIGIGPGDRNRVLSNDVSNNVRVGVEISNFSDNNQVKNNIINNNGLVAHEQGGVAIFNGTGNLIANNALNNNFMGIEIESPGNVAQRNHVSGSVDTGIFITSFGSPGNVNHNTVFGSGLVDMLDEQRECDSNTWTGNNFVTDLVADLSDGGPGVGCLQ